MKRIHRNKVQLVEEPGGINVPQLVFFIRKNILWFLGFAALGLLAALFYIKVFPQKYTVSSILVAQNNNNAQATLTTVQQHPDDNRKGSAVQNQIGVLKSFTVNYQTVKNLKWDYSWYDNSFFRKKDLYKDAPFEVLADSLQQQTKGVKLHIRKLNRKQYSVSCDQEQKENDVKQQIRFDEIHEFGKPFRNRYFGFTLNKIPGRIVPPEQEFILEFNDPVRLAQSYQQALKIKAGDDAESKLIYISLESTELSRSIDYLNELGKVCIDYGLTEKNQVARNTVSFIDRQIAHVADSLKSSGSSFTSYRSDKKIVDIGQQSSSLIQNFDRLGADESGLRSRVSQLRNLRASLNNPREMAGFSSADPSLNAMASQLAELLRQREVLSYSAQDASPQMISLNNEISYVRSSLLEGVNGLLYAAERELGRLVQQKQNIVSQQSDLPATEQTLNSIKRDFDLNNELYTYLLKKKSEAQIAEASRDPDVKILDAAGPGTAAPAGMGKYMLILLGTVAGGSIPLAYLILKMFYKKKLVFITDVTARLRLSVVGNILYNKYDTELPVVFYPQSEITESFRGLRMNVQYLLKDLQTKVIAVHSAIEGEGKTFVSSNLAAILAMNNKTVLLVDADLRKPRSHKIFNCSNEVGLANYLNEELAFSEVVIPLSIKGLSIVNSGPKPLYPSELLHNGMLSKFISEAAEHYEYIIFNTSPVSIVSDSMTIAPYCDMNLFLLRMKNSSRDQLVYLNQLAQDGIIRNMAVALNNVTNESYGILQQKRYGYYNDNKLLSSPE